MIYFGISIVLILLLVTSLVSTNVLGQTNSLAVGTPPSNSVAVVEKFLTGVFVDCSLATYPGPQTERCNNGMPWLKIECEINYNVSEMCRQDRPIINKYISDKGLDSIDTQYFHDQFQTKIVDSGLSYEEIITQGIS
jgi:hypothetical protein